MGKKGVPFDPNGGARRRQKRRIDGLHDSYIRRMLSTQTGIPSGAIPDWLISLKRERIANLRLLGELRKTLKEKRDES